MSDTNQQLLSELKETFKMFDVDGDGVISVQELKLVMKKFGYNMSEEDLEKLIKQLDKDGNGTIELQQYLDVMMKNSMERSQILDQNSELMATFRLFDVNQDGLISAEQLKQGLEILGNKGEPITEQDIKQLLDAADIDGDGYINYEQFVRMLKFK